MRAILTSLALLATTICIARSNSGQCFYFDRTVLELDGVIAGAGPVEGTFILTNTGDSPISILDAHSTCGCTAVEWTKGAINPGKTGRIGIKYTHNDPPGHFDKAVFVRLSCCDEPVILKVRGDAFRNEDPSSELKTAIPVRNWPWNGPLRLRSTSYNCGDTSADEEPEIIITVYNRSRRPSNLHLEDISDGMTVQVDSTKAPTAAPVAGKGTAKIHVTLKPGVKYGYQEFTVRASSSRKAKTARRAHAITLTFHINVIPAAGTPLPSLSIAEKILSPDSNGSAEATFSNSGNECLDIIGLKTSSDFLTASLDKDSLSPGQSATLKIHATRSRALRKLQTVTILTNDPLHPSYKLIISRQ